MNDFLRNALVICTLFLSVYAFGQPTGTTINGNKNQTISGVQLNAGTGSPVGMFACDATVVTATTASMYIQRDAAPGQALWICTMQTDGATYLWIQRPSATATATGTTLIAAGSFLVAGCNTTIFTVAVPGAVIGSNGVVMTPVYSTAPTATSPGFLYLPGWVSAANVVSFQVCSLGTLSNYPSFFPRALLY